MPSGPAHLHERWGHDGAALAHLESVGLKPNRGGIFQISRSKQLSETDISALDYLFMEWDYGTEWAD